MGFEDFWLWCGIYAFRSRIWSCVEFLNVTASLSTPNMLQSMLQGKLTVVNLMACACPLPSSCLTTHQTHCFVLYLPSSLCIQDVRMVSMFTTLRAWWQAERPSNRTSSVMFGTSDVSFQSNPEPLTRFRQPHNMKCQTHTHTPL